MAKKGQLTPQQMLEQGINGVLNSNPITAPINMIRNTIPQVPNLLKQTGKVVNSAVDAVPYAEEVLNHPALGVVTAGNPALGAVLGVAGTASQVAGGERATLNLNGKKPNDDWADPVAGKGPDSNQVGSEVDQSTWSQKPAAPAQPAGGSGGGSGEPRVNANGLVSYGKDLSSLNAFTKDFTGGYELADVKTAFQSEDLPVKGSEGTNTDYSMGDAEAMGRSKEDALTIGQGGFVETLITPSTPATTGNNPTNSQDGTSSKPDVAESIRQVRMARTEGSPRGFNGADFSGAEPDDSSLVSPMYANAKRNKIRSTFLDHEGSSVQAIAAANAVAGYGKDSNADARFNVGGELVYAKDGMQQKAKNAAMMGQDPTQFLDIPATPDTQPDTPAASELSPSFAKVTPGAQEFFKAEIKKVKDKNK